MMHQELKLGAIQKGRPRSGGRGGSAQRGQSKATFIVTMTSKGDKGEGGKKNPDFEGTSFMDAPQPETISVSQIWNNFEFFATKIVCWL